MYTNIDNIHGINILGKWLTDYSDNVPKHFTSEFLLKVLNIIMSNNIFQFDNIFWLQICGTAMGTSCACSYTTLYWAYIERKHILPKWSPALPFLQRFIHDKLGVWTGSEEEFQLFIPRFKLLLPTKMHI
jgi:hypothetical protein